MRLRNEYKKRVFKSGSYSAGYFLCLAPFMSLIKNRIKSSKLANLHNFHNFNGSGYNMTSRPTLEGRNQQIIVSDRVLIYAIYGTLSMSCGTATAP